MKTPIYILSGLGADERVFKKLDFTNYQVTFIQWEQTIGLSLKEYATLQLKQIKEPNPILIGLSFGGIIAIEIAQQISVKKLYLFLL
jgi:esterase/lipase